MPSQRKPRPKTKRQVQKMVEEIVLTEEDEKILDDVWKEMRRKLIQKRRQQERKKTAHQILQLARENQELRTEIVQTLMEK